MNDVEAESALAKGERAKGLWLSLSNYGTRLRILVEPPLQPIRFQRRRRRMRDSLNQKEI